MSVLCWRLCKIAKHVGHPVWLQTHKVLCMKTSPCLNVLIGTNILLFAGHQVSLWYNGKGHCLVLIQFETFNDNLLKGACTKVKLKLSNSPVGGQYCLICTEILSSEDKGLTFYDVHACLCQVLHSFSRLQTLNMQLIHAYWLIYKWCNFNS